MCWIFRGELSVLLGLVLLMELVVARVTLHRCAALAQVSFNSFSIMIFLGLLISPIFSLFPFYIPRVVSLDLRLSSHFSLVLLEPLFHPSHPQSDISRPPLPPPLDPPHYSGGLLLLDQEPLA